ncbi:ABC transporter ATP-binding protein [Flavobacteriaceae bacterium]|nr:ABC transporter ATP-binding protein [Flavobacteriaceae bacterium]
MDDREVILKVENLSKQYRLGLVGTGTLSHDFNRWWHRIRGKEDPYLKIGETNDRSTKGESEYVWALRDINFEVRRGEVLGIIGKNGAGKSTLLKILSRVTSPTTGSIKTKGRIASLLEVGTGFHGEMTGRENIYLNGAILGMTKKEITAKIDEIIEFSGCERYIDTPVKRYSSGMTVRLAFAVAAFLEPDILIVDEVLAVGDAEFQKKAIGKMQDISSGEGRTVLFVSHNMASVKSLCSRGIILENGLIQFSGEINECIESYLGYGKEVLNKNLRHNIFNNLDVRLDLISVRQDEKFITEIIEEDGSVVVETKLYFETDKAKDYHITFHLHDETGNDLFSFGSRQHLTFNRGNNFIRCLLPDGFLQHGNYSLSLFLVTDKKKPVFVEKNVIYFSVIHAQKEIGAYMGREPGSIRPKFNWSKT